MQAIRVHECGGPEVLVLDTLPTPKPGPGEALVRVSAAGVNFIEIYHRTGHYPLPLPIPLGGEGAGIVEALGPGDSPVAVGERVAWAGGQGAYATEAIVAADRLVPLPAGLDEHLAAAVMIQGLTAHYLTRSSYPLKPGDTCLVHAAAGGVGQLLCQMAKSAGARVIGTGSTEEKLSIAEAAGADETINYEEVDFVERVKALTGGIGVQVVYDGVGRKTFSQGLDCLVPRGYMILFGGSSGPVVPFDPLTLFRKGSLYLQRPTLWDYIRTRDELVERATEMFGWITSGRLKVAIAATFPLGEAAEAHRLLAARKAIGKILLIP
jgi:NADPH2:quinone reductase